MTIEGAILVIQWNFIVRSRIKNSRSNIGATSITSKIISILNLRQTGSKKAKTDTKKVH